MFELVIKGDFAAAHHLRNYHGKCENLHGHNYLVEIYVSQKRLNKQGMVIDFNVLKSLLDEVLGEFDHKYLNDLKDFNKLNPTAENIAFVIHREFTRKLPKPMHLKVCVWESTRTGASYYNVV